MTDLEARLHALRDDVAWPPTPDLVSPTVARIASEPQRPARWPRPSPPAWRRPAAVLATVLVALLAAAAVLLAASPGVRARVADWLGIGAVRIDRVERLPPVGPAGDLELGERTTLAAARRRTSAPVPVVRALGAPDGVYAISDVSGEIVSLVYLARPGLPPSTGGIGALLTVLPGDAFELVQKLVEPDVPVRRVRVDGAEGVFIEGRHVLIPPQRLAGNTLVWTTGDATYRLETELGGDAALRLARSVR